MRQRLPIGQQSFEVLRKKNKIYVDKTGQLVELMDDVEYCFLSRPRRFGKSLMISTLEAMFRGKKDLFTGLAAESWVIEQAKHPSPVLRFDMSMGNKETAENFRISLEDYLDFLADDFKVSLKGRLLESRFQELLRKLYDGSGVVVLIDEYDSPILYNINKPERAEEVRGVLSSFYQVLKSSSQYLRFVMLTGISKFSKLSIFSAMNNLKDISMDPRWGMLVGFTQEELEMNFGPWLDNFAKVQSISCSEVIQRMKDYYDGFCFDGEHHVYNPWSVLNCLDEKKLGDYWYETTTPSYLVKSLRKFGVGEIDRYEGIVVNKNFTSACEIEHATPESFLYQSGYLTIKECKDSSLTLGYPNFEVRQAISRSYLEQFYGVKNFQSISDCLLLALNKEDVKTVERLFNEALAAVAYENLGKAGNDEALYHSLLGMLLTTAGVIAPSEVQNAVGRTDIIAFVGNLVYIMELKVAKKKTTVPKMLNEAAKQIEDKQYMIPYRNKGKTVIAVAVVINVSERQCIMQEISHC